MNKTIKTTLTRYRLDVSKDAEKAEYKELCCTLKKTRKKTAFLVSPRDKGNRPEAGELEIETNHLFSNQFNTKCGHRVFSWFEAVYPNEDIKDGHYLDLTDELSEALRNTYVCGYCGHQEAAAKGNVFCDKCLDSEYLNKKELHLLRLLPVAEYLPKREPLTKAEEAHLLPLFVERQTTGATSRNAAKLKKQRSDLEKKFKKETESAKAEYEGLTWLMDHNLSIDNVIYYNHADKFCFGWRSKLDDEVVSELLDVISEFPFPYEIKGHERSWEGY